FKRRYHGCHVDDAHQADQREYHRRKRRNVDCVSPIEPVAWKLYIPAWSKVDGQQIDRHGNRNEIDYSWCVTAGHHVEIAPTQKVRHEKCGDAHNRWHELTAK